MKEIHQAKSKTRNTISLMCPACKTRVKICNVKLDKRVDDKWEDGGGDLKTSMPGRLHLCRFPHEPRRKPGHGILRVNFDRRINSNNVPSTNRPETCNEKLSLRNIRRLTQRQEIFQLNFETSWYLLQKLSKKNNSYKYFLQKITD